MGYKIDWQPETDKVMCGVCGARFTRDDIIKVQNPLSTVEELWSVCPQCRTPEHLLVVCFYPGCREQTTFREKNVDIFYRGTPTTTGYGYVHTCGDHVPRRANSRA